MTETKLIIFDCDGVLVDTEIIGCKVLAEHLNRNGIDVSIATCLSRYVGLSATSIQEKAEADSGIALPPTFPQDIRRDTLQELSHGVEAIPGVKDCLEKIENQNTGGWRVCVASSGLPEKIHQSLTLSGLIEFFDSHLFSAISVAHGKPAPDLFLHVANAMEVVPDVCVVVEDSVAGIQGAIAAGMISVGFTGGSHVTREHGELLRSAGATHIINDMRELPILLGI